MERYLFRSYFSLPLSTIYHYRRNKKRFSVSIDNHGAFIISTFAWSFRATISWKITRQARNKIPGLTSCNDTISCLNRHRIIGLRRKRTVPEGRSCRIFPHGRFAEADVTQYRLPWSPPLSNISCHGGDPHG